MVQRPSKCRLLRSCSLDRDLHIDTLRTIGVLWVMFYHWLFISGWHLESSVFSEAVMNPWYRILGHGHFGVDIFFVISGFLIANKLISEYFTTGTIALVRFYLRRLARILPLFYIVNVGYVLLNLEKVQWIGFFANLVLINNFLPLDRQILSWGWSLAVEWHFYVICPIVLIYLFVRRNYHIQGVFIAFVLIVLGCFFLNWLSVDGPGYDKYPVFHPNFDGARFYAYASNIYQKTFFRIGSLFLGVLWAVTEHSPLLSGYLRRHQGQLSVAGVCGFLLMAMHVLVPLDFDRPSFLSDLLFKFHLANYRYIFSLGLVLFMLFIRWHRVEKVLPKAGEKYRFVLVALAELSYGAYLVHPFWIVYAFSRFPVESLGGIDFFGNLLLVYVVSFFCAWLCYEIFENHFREMVRR